MNQEAIAVDTSLLSLEDVSKSYGGVHALRGVKFDIRPGEIHALLGENGAGKSTLIKIIAGAVAGDSGEIRWHGDPIEIRTVADSMRLGIRVIFQQLNVIPHLTVAENLTLGREESTFGLLRSSTNRRHAKAALERLGLTLELDQPASTLRVAEKQLVEIARAISSDAQLLIMDEPTASLGEHEVTRLFEVIRDLRDDGLGIVYISHRLEEILGLADRITVLRDGLRIDTVSASDTTRQDLISMMVGRELGHAIRKESHAEERVVLEVKSVSTDSGLKNVSLAVRENEVLGIYGLLGSGRTELARALFGADPIRSGEVLLNRERVDYGSPRDAIHNGIGLVAEDRETQGIFPQLSVHENLTSASSDLMSKFGWIRSSTAEELSLAAVENLRIKTPSIDQPIWGLSGGNQQKVTVARWLMRKSQVLILDDPTVGVDVGAKDDLYGLIEEMTTEGTTIILISSDLPEIIGLADRIVVLHQGRVVGTLEGSDLTQEAVMRLALGE